MYVCMYTFSSSDCHHVFSYALETNNCEVSALLHLPTLGRVAAALSNGRYINELFLYICIKDNLK